MMSTRSNYAPGIRAWVQFTAQIPSGSPTSGPFPYVIGDYALGTVSLSGALGCTGHLGVKGADYWGLYRVPRSWSANYSDWVIQTPSGQMMHDMPERWFTLVGSAMLWLTDGSGSGMPATAAAAYAVSLKS
jgi:hypothetical protein